MWYKIVQIGVVSALYYVQSFKDYLHEEMDLCVKAWLGWFHFMSLGFEIVPISPFFWMQLVCLDTSFFFNLIQIQVTYCHSFCVRQFIICCIFCVHSPFLIYFVIKSGQHRCHWASVLNTMVIWGETIPCDFIGFSNFWCFSHKFPDVPLLCGVFSSAQTSETYSNKVGNFNRNNHANSFISSSILLLLLQVSFSDLYIYTFSFMSVEIQLTFWNIFQKKLVKTWWVE